MEKSRIASLDSLRFFMILNTTFCHITWIQSWGNYALGVDFFYILSGFFILYSINQNEDKKEALLALHGIKNYYLYAFKRNKKMIFWYYITIIITLPVQFYKLTLWHDVPYAIMGTLLTVIVTPTLLQAAFGLGQASHLGIDQGGFISVLFMIQMCFPTLLRAYKRQGKVSPIIKIVVSFILLMLFQIFFGVIDEFSFFNDLRYGSPYTRIWYFIIGMCLCEVIEKTKINSYVISTLFEIGIILLMIAWIVFPHFGIINIHNYYLSEAINILICVLLIVVFAHQAGAISKILSGRILVVLGKCAMYIYLFHYFFIWIIELGLSEELKVKYSFLWTIFVIIGTGLTTYGAYAYDKRKKSTCIGQI